MQKHPKKLLPLNSPIPIPLLQNIQTNHRGNTTRSYTIQHKYQQYLPNTQSTINKYYGSNCYDQDGFNSHCKDSCISSMGRGNNIRKGNQGDNSEYSTNEILQRNRELSKKQIWKQSKYLRQKLWLNIESMFRNISEYSDQFYQGLYTILNTDHNNQSLISLSNSQTLQQIRKYLIKQLRNNSLLLNRDKMENMMQNIVQKIQQYLIDVQENGIKQVFGMEIISHDIADKQHDTHRARQTYRQNTMQKSNSMSKYPNYKIPPLQHNCNQYQNQKDRQFKELYDRITIAQTQRYFVQNSKYNTPREYGICYKGSNTSEQQIGQPRYQIHSDNGYYCNQYGLENEYVIENYKEYPSRMKRNQNIIYRSYHNLQNVHQNTSNNNPNQPIIYYHHSTPNSMSISKIHNKQQNICDKVFDYPNISHHIVKEPILNFTNNISNMPSEHQFQINYVNNVQNNKNKNYNYQDISKFKNKKQPTRYLLDNNQQCAYCDWCEEIAIDSEITSIDANNNQDRQYYIKKMQNQSLLQFRQDDKKSVNNTAKIKSTTSQKQKKLSPLLLCLTYCNNYRHLAVGCKNGLINIYSTQSLELVTKLEGHTSAITCLHASSENFVLFSGGDTPCNCIIIWNCDSWTIRSKLALHSAAVSSLAHIPNTDYLISTSFDRTLKLYNYSSSTVTDMYISSGIMFTKVLYYQQLQMLIAMTPSKILRVWNNEGYKIGNERVITCGGKITCIEKAITSQKYLLIVGVHNGYLQIFKLPQITKLSRIEVNKNPILSMLTFSRNSKNTFPLIFLVCYRSKSLYLLNTQSRLIFQLNIKGNLDINFTQGIGPVMIMNQQYVMSWIDQNQENAMIYFAKFFIF